MRGVLDTQGSVSAAERLILLNATGIMLVVGLPAIVLTLVFLWTGSHEAKPIRIDVVSPDWKWLFIYPDRQIAATRAFSGSRSWRRC